MLRVDSSFTISKIRVQSTYAGFTTHPIAREFTSAPTPYIHFNLRIGTPKLTRRNLPILISIQKINQKGYQNNQRRTISHKLIQFSLSLSVASPTTKTNRIKDPKPPRIPHHDTMTPPKAQPTTIKSNQRPSWHCIIEDQKAKHSFLKHQQRQ